VHGRQGVELRHVALDGIISEPLAARQRNQVEHLFDDAPLDVGKNRVVVGDRKRFLYRCTALPDERRFQGLGAKTERISATVVSICTPLSEIISGLRRDCSRSSQLGELASPFSMPSHLVHDF